MTGEPGQTAAGSSPSIFISYAREDRARASDLAALFEQRGWLVWWDDKIPIGRSFDEVIERALNSARCVVVLWTANSVASRWVKAEAQVGLDRATLLPVSLDDARPPLAFRDLETVQLSGWQGDLQHPEFEKLLQQIATRLDDTSPPPPEARPPRRTGRLWLWHAVAALACAALVFIVLPARKIPGPRPPAWVFDDLAPALLELYRTADDLDTASGLYLGWRPSTAAVFERQVRDLGRSIKSYNDARSKFAAQAVGFRLKVKQLRGVHESLYDTSLNLIARASEFAPSYDPPRYDPASELDEQYNSLLSKWQEEKNLWKGHFAGIDTELEQMERELLVSAGRDVEACGS